MDYSYKVKSVGDSLAELEIKELGHLSKYMEETYGIQMAFQSGTIPNHGIYAMPMATQAVSENIYKVVMESFGDHKLNVVKVVKYITNLSLMDSKRLVESVPCIVKDNLTYSEAERIRKELEEVGGKASVASV
jgi:large subunit ribosomal protein L7/L12